MDLRELLRKIRTDKNMSFQELANKTGYSRGYLSDVEQGKSVSKKLLEQYIKVFPVYKDKLINAYAEEKLPKVADTQNINLVNLFSIKVYDYISNSDGKINIEEYEEIEFPFTKNDEELIVNNSFVFKVKNNALEPNIIEDDIIYFVKKNFENWEVIDRRLVLVMIDKDYYIKKVGFIKGKAYLFSFNENVYPEKEITNKVKFIGILGGLLKRYNNELKF